MNIFDRVVWHKYFSNDPTIPYKKTIFFVFVRLRLRKRDIQSRIEKHSVVKEHLIFTISKTKTHFSNRPFSLNQRKQHSRIEFITCRLWADVISYFYSKTTNCT